jgi:hypothetical protein
VLPLLDGLDELPPHHQATAVQQINQWLDNASTSLVVCCCCEDYNRYPTPLALNGTLTLEPLTPEQLETYLGSLELNILWAQIQKSPELLELIRIPFWLNLLISTQDTPDFATWEKLEIPPGATELFAGQVYPSATSATTCRQSPTNGPANATLAEMAGHTHQ